MQAPSATGAGITHVALSHTEARERAVVLGLGTSATARVLFDAGFRNVDAAPGRSFLRETPERYDVIVVRSSRVWRAGSSELESRELYELAKDRLSAEGRTHFAP